MGGSDTYNTVNVCSRVVNALVASVIIARPSRIYRIKCNSGPGLVIFTDGLVGRTIFSEIMAVGDVAEFNDVPLDTFNNVSVGASIPGASDYTLYTD